MITPLTSSNFMNIDLRSFSIPVLKSLAATIEQNIKSRLSLHAAPPAPTKQTAFVNISSWGKLIAKTPLKIEWDPTKIKNEKNEFTPEALALLSQNQDGLQVDPKQEEFPWTYQIGERKHRCSGDRLKACPTLFYINEFDGVLCTHCFLSNGGKRVDKLFFDRPFQTWHKLKNKYNEHVNADRCLQTAPHKFNFQRM